MENQENAVTEEKVIGREFIELLDGTKSEVAKTITLDDGRIVKICIGSGEQAMEAQESSQDEKGSSVKKYLSSLMSQLITIDGNFLSPEDIRKLPMKAYNKISVEFSAVNF